MSNLTHEAWMTELAKLSRRSDAGRTRLEWATLADVSERIMGTRLAEMNRLGWVKLGWRSIVRIDGRPAKVPVYQIIVPKGKK